MTSDRPTYLYRLFDSTDQLLYVGIGFDPKERWREHRLTKGWWPDVARKTVEMFPTRQDAKDAETGAVANEYPVHNKSPRAYVTATPSQPRMSSSARCGAWVPNRYGSEYGPPTRLACMEQRGHDGVHRSTMGVEWAPGGVPAVPARKEGLR